MKSASDRIIVALDVCSCEEAMKLVEQLGEHVGMFKIGLELFTAEGPQIIQKILAVGGKVFLDLKFHDIPNTVARSAANVARWNVSMFNVHAVGGRDMMEAAVSASREAISTSEKRPLVLAVTMLTSLDRRAMNDQLRIPGTIEDQVVNLARQSLDVGIDGIIASPQELSCLRQSIPSETVIVTPGVRPSWSQLADQRRVATPREAISHGASYLVIGRPITHPPPSIGGPVAAAKLIAGEISSAEN